MKKIQFSKDFFKKSSFILGLILISFLFKEIFIISIFPIFRGQDEARHYNTAQYLAEPKEKTWKITYPSEKKGGKERDKLETYNFSNEIKETSKLADVTVFRRALFRKPVFENGYNGKNEERLNTNLKPYNEIYPPDITGRPHLYHKIVSLIEKLLFKENILVRFFFGRIFSAILGTFLIFLSYFIFKNLGFSKKHSLLLTTIVSLQPKLSTYFSNINYDVLLIPLFALFTLGAVLAIKNNLDWKNLSIMLFSIILGMFTKATSIILIPIFITLIVLQGYKMYKKSKYFKNHVKKIILILTFLISVPVIILSNNFGISKILTVKKNASFLEIVSLLKNYLNASYSRIDSSSRTYWGSLDWTQGNFSDNMINWIWFFEFFVIIGIIYFLFSRNKIEFLPQKKYIIFLAGIIFFLQLGTRFYDWKIFIVTGGFDLGTPGRYFLPNLIAHIALMFIGIGALLHKEKYFDIALKAGLVFMFFFSMYLTFNTILPRFYL